MRKDQLANLAKYGVSFDTETHRVQPGLLAPPLVCGSVAQCIQPPNHFNPQEDIAAELLSKEDTLIAFRALIEDPNRILITANGAYDVLVCLTEWAKRGVDLFPEVFQAYEDGRVYDVLIAQALNAIADGNLGEDPFTGGDMRDPISGDTTNRYSLALVVLYVLGRGDAKVNDEWRQRYALLENIPMADWPAPARDYPVDDVRNTHEAALAQVGLLPRVSRHVWRRIDNKAKCTECGCGYDEGQDPPPCMVVKKFRNLHSMRDQAYTAFAMHVGAAWGFNVDQAAVTDVEKIVIAKRARVAVPLVEKGLLKWKKDKGETKLGKDTGAIAQAVALAYGADPLGQCPVCNGTHKVPSPKNPKSKINCQACRSTGLDLEGVQIQCTDPSERFPNGQIQAGRDVLYESGDDTLRELAEWGEDAKTVTNYVPYLRTAQTEVKGSDGVVIRYPRPLTLKPNVLLETDRVSYGDAIQQFPRDGGLRATIIARHGFILCSSDYNQGELVSHGQSCLWILGYSDLAVAMNAGADPHAGLAATVLGVGYEEFLARKKEKTFADMRQASKPINFGKPGGMGVAKIVLNQRIQGPDTPCPGGPVMLDDGNGGKIPGYKGTRFCILMDGAEACGVEKVTQWGRRGYERLIKPTCLHCLQCVERLVDSYNKQWSESKDYFAFTSWVVEHGQPLTDEQCEIHDLPLGSNTEPGVMCMHVSNLLRGGVQFTDCSNGYFQALLAVASKMAFRQVQRECCDRSFIIPLDPMFGVDVSKYAGQPSPLFGSRAIVLQHDEIISELRESRAHDAAMRQSEIMEGCLQEVCPDMVMAAKAPSALMARWLKQAAPILHSGKLVPWTPDHKPKTCVECAAN